MRNFWKKLSRPFSVLAPLDGVSDFVFREIVTDLGKPNVFFTEFTNVEALFSKGKDTQIKRLTFSKKQKPIVAQLWGINPENFKKSAALVKDLGFDGIDLNMGCPDRTVRKNGACSALMEDREKAKDSVKATLEGANGLPVSIKTRLGRKEFDKSWFEFLLKFKIAALTIHLRTVKDLSLVPAKWEYLNEIVNLRNKLKSNTYIIGNGDINSLEEGRKLSKKYDIDGFMIGRGIFKNPCFFDEEKEEFTREKKLHTLVKHARLFEKQKGNTKNFAIMKKFFKIYCSGFEGALDLRTKLMNCSSVDEVEETIFFYETFDTLSMYPTKSPIAVATPPITNISSALLKGL